jgi:hypothetical protein
MSSSVDLDPAMRGPDDPDGADVPGPPDEFEGDDILGQWPRMLVLSEEAEDRLKQYLDNEIQLMWQERDTLVGDWSQWQKDYWAKPAEKVKNFPFRRASNIVIPMTAIAVEAIMARMLTTIFSVKPFFSIRPRIKEWIEVAPNVESWLQTEVEDPQSLDMDGFARESLLELIKLGTGVGKSGYERDLRKINVDLPDGSVTAKWVEVRNGPTLGYVPLANFLMRLHDKDPQTAPMVGEEHRDVTWAQLKRYALSGRMYKKAIRDIRHWWGSTVNIESTAQKYEDDRKAMEGTEPSWEQNFGFVEMWLGFDVDGDGIDEEIVVDYHKDSQTILSIRYNWYDDLHRPYRIGVYIPVEGRWVGIGVGKQLEQFQALITTVHRQRLDAGTLANIGMLALKKTSGYTSDEPLWPGKLWFVDNPQTDIAPIQMSNTQHFAQISNEENARQYADKRSGANELVLGTPHIGTPGTATSDLAKLAEGNKKFDMVLKNVRRWYSLIGLDALANFQQFGSRGRSWTVRGADGKWVDMFLQLPQGDIRRGAFVELTVTDSITNKEVEQTKWMQLFGALSAHYDKVLERSGQVAGLLQDPSVFILFAEMALKGSNAAMRRMLEAFGVPDIETFLLDLEKMAQNAQSLGPGAQPPGVAQRGQEALRGAGSGVPALSAGATGGSVAGGNGVVIES